MDDGYSSVPPSRYASEEIALKGCDAQIGSGHQLALVSLA